MDINSIYTFFKGYDYSKFLTGGVVIALLKGVHSIYQRRKKVGILNDADVIAEISGFNLESFRTDTFQPNLNYDAAFESFEAMCTRLNDRNLNQELDRMKAELKKIADKAKETTNSESAPESEYYMEFAIFGLDYYTPPLLPRYRNVDEDVKAWKNLFTTFRMNAKKYTNKVKVLA